MSLLLVSSVVAQPRIDSMWVDELGGKLFISGQFGSAVGAVACDSVALTIQYWSDTLVVATILDTGRGSVGQVAVETNGKFSAPEYLTRWTIASGTSYQRSGSRIEYSTEATSISIRMDLQAYLRFPGRSSFTFVPSRRSYLYEYYSYDQIPYDPQWGYDVNTDMNQRGFLQDTSLPYTAGFSALATFNPDTRSFRFNIYDVRGYKKEIRFRTTANRFVDTTIPYPIADFSRSYTLNSRFSVDTFSQTTGNPPYYFTQYVTDAKVEFLPPSWLLGISNRPVLVSPSNSSVDLGTSDASLVWHSLPFLDSFRVQLSLDSSLIGSLVDSVVTDTTLKCPVLRSNTTYFWRVAGINSEGQSRWSDVWHFTTGTNAGVPELKAPSTDVALTPNPADRYVTVSVSGAGLHEVSVYDMLGRLVQQSTIDASPSVRLDIGGLVNGSYIIDADHTLRGLLRVEHGSR